MSSDKRFVGVFHTEQEVVSKIQELTASGVSDEYIYVVAKDNDELHTVKDQTDAEVQPAAGKWTDKFMNFLAGENQIDNLLKDTGLSEAQKGEVHVDIQNGGMMVYVDEGEVGETRNENNTNYAESDEANIANLESEAPIESDDQTAELVDGHERGTLTHGHHTDSEFKEPGARIYEEEPASLDDVEEIQTENAQHAAKEDVIEDPDEYTEPKYRTDKF
ncbi:general stress protein [Sporosarcina aquimarina]|uniref:General stress protein n=1 Tax=Sporosarcina aquimarina TaxID=114975 RepID=A0ABU4FVW2_9BACL|nr:general stress protein [Sporosarcina aquimarina]MDW0108843.1 general stress protein [Sporosarcina aquimarina]